MKTVLNFEKPTDFQVSEAIEIIARHAVVCGIEHLEDTDVTVCKSRLHDFLDAYEGEEHGISEGEASVAQDIVALLEVPEFDEDPGNRRSEVNTVRFEVEWLEEFEDGSPKWRILTEDSPVQEVMRFETAEAAIRSAESLCDRTTWRVVKVHESRETVVL